MPRKRRPSKQGGACKRRQGNARPRTRTDASAGARSFWGSCGKHRDMRAGRGRLAAYGTPEAAAAFPRRNGSRHGNVTEFRKQGGNDNGAESCKRGNSGGSCDDGWQQPVAARGSQRRSIGREGARSDGLRRRTRTRSCHGGGSNAVGTRAWHLPRPRARPNRQPTALATGMAPRSHPLAPEQPQAAHGSAPSRRTEGWPPDRRPAPGAAQRILRQGSPYAADFGAAA